MECREVTEYLPAYVDEAEGPRADAIEEHLRTCGECRTEVAHFKELVAGLQAMAQVTEEPPVWLLDRITEAVARRADQLTRIRSRYQQVARPRNVAAAGALVVAGAVALQLMKRRKRRTVLRRLRTAVAA